MNKARFKRLIKFIFEPLFSRFKNKNKRHKMIYATQSKKSIFEKTIFLEAYSGENVTGNSLALFNELYYDPRFKNYTFVWSINDLNNIHSKYKKNNRVKYVSRNTKSFIKYLARSKYLITDTTFPFYFNKRKEQKYIMAWHGTPYKTIGKDIIHTKKNAHKNVMKNILHTDFFISPSKYTTNTILESQNAKELFSGEILELGMPRTDLSYKVDTNYLKEEMNLPLDKKVVLYAPTWNDFKKNNISSSFDLAREVDQLSNLLGPDYIVALKVHYLEYQAIKDMDTNCYLVNNQIDTNEILQITDYLITDYSSIFFDYLPLEKPIFFYFNNYNEYSEKRGLYLKKEDLPGEICEDLIQLSEKIKTTNNNLNNKFLSMANKYAPYDDGSVSKRVINYIFFEEKPSVGEIYKTETTKEKILFYSGFFKKNGITESFIRLMDNFDFDKYSITLIIPCDVPKNSYIERVLDRLHPCINIIYPVGRLNLTTIDHYKYTLFINRGLNGVVKKIPPHDIMAREYNCIVGNTTFDKTIDFSGYNAYYGALFAFSDAKEKIVFLHSDMEKDKGRKVKKKHPNWLPLQLMFSIYYLFDKILSVSETSHQANVSKLGNKLGISKKMDYINNVLGAERIENMSENYNTLNLNSIEILTDHITDIENTFSIKGILKPSKDNVNYITLGRLSPEKNHTLLINSFKKVLETTPNARLYIVGEGKLYKNLVNLTKRLEIEDNVIFTGHLDNPFYLLKQCDVFVLTSLYEGQALVILEALAVGLKVISTDIPGPDNILKEGYGELVEPTEIGLSRKMISISKTNKQYKKFNPYEYDDKTFKRIMKKIN